VARGQHLQLANKSQPHRNSIFATSWWTLEHSEGRLAWIPFTQGDLNKAGAVAGYAETPIPDPFAPNCASPSCSVQHAFLWRDGVMTELLGFIPNLESGAQAINEAGIAVGEAQNGLADPESGGAQFARRES
jgi:hypothetical protein